MNRRQLMSSVAAVGSAALLPQATGRREVVCTMKFDEEAMRRLMQDAMRKAIDKAVCDFTENFREQLRKELKLYED